MTETFMDVAIMEGHGFFHFFLDSRMHIAYSLDEAKTKIKWLKHPETFHKELMDIIEND